jgi:hypothetical protein
VRLKKERADELAAKAAERARQKQEKDAAKALKMSQNGKRKASQAASSSNKLQKHAGGQSGGVQVQDEPSAAPPKLTSRGRNIKLPGKYR